MPKIVRTPTGPSNGVFEAYCNAMPIPDVPQNFQQQAPNGTFDDFYANNYPCDRQEYAPVSKPSGKKLSFRSKKKEFIGQSNNSNWHGQSDVVADHRYYSTQEHDNWYMQQAPMYQQPEPMQCAQVPMYNMSPQQEYSAPAEDLSNATADYVTPIDVGTRNYINRSNTSFMSEFCKIAEGSMRTKPAYSECWLVGNRDDLEKIAEYETYRGKVMIGTAIDGETEYNLLPNEYMLPDSLNSLISEAIEKVRETFRVNGGRMDKQSVMSVARGILIGYSDAIESVYGSESCQLEAAINEICDIVYRYTVGLGIFDTLLSDPKLEDIYIDAPCEKNRILHMCQHMQTAVSPTWQRSINTPLFPNHATFGRSAYSA